MTPPPLQLHFIDGPKDGETLEIEATVVRVLATETWRIVGNTRAANARLASEASHGYRSQGDEPEVALYYDPPADADDVPTNIPAIAAAA